MSKTRKPVVFLEGERLYLRPLELGDLPRCQRWFNDPVTRRFMTAAYPQNEEAVRKWFDEVAAADPHLHIECAIVLKQRHQHIGLVRLHNINMFESSAATGMVIGESSMRGKGYGPEAKDLLVEYAFNTLGLHRLSTRVLAGNTGSIASVLKSGFKEEGRDRESLFREGVWMDDVRFGLLQHEWRELREKSRKKEG